MLFRAAEDFGLGIEPVRTLWKEVIIRDHQPRAKLTFVSVNLVQRVAARQHLHVRPEPL